jgi:hypothetical protein
MFMAINLVSGGTAQYFLSSLLKVAVVAQTSLVKIQLVVQVAVVMLELEAHTHKAYLEKEITEVSELLGSKVVLAGAERVLLE